MPIRIDQARENLKKPVVYSPPGGEQEHGIITEVRGDYVFVRYGDDQHAKATHPLMLDFLELADPGAEPVRITESRTSTPGKPHRVRWKCGAIQCSKHVHEGHIWRADPNLKTSGDDDYAVAARLGLVADPRPPGHHYALVEFDDRPGVLQCHSWHELEVLYE